MDKFTSVAYNTANRIINNHKITTLSKEDVEGKKKLTALKNYGIGSQASELCYLMEGNHASRRNNYFVLSKSDKEIYTVFPNGNVWNHQGFDVGEAESYSIRPVINFDDIDNYEIIGNENDTDIVEYGEFPQDIVDQELFSEIEEKYNNNELEATQKTYRLPSMGKKNMKYEEYTEYLYKDKKLIRYKKKCDYYGNEELPSGKDIPDSEYVWVEVKPIEWLVDYDSKKLIAKNNLVSGIDLVKYVKKDLDFKFEPENLFRYLKECFLDDIQPSFTIISQESTPEETEYRMAKMIQPDLSEEELYDVIANRREDTKNKIINYIDNIVNEYKKEWIENKLKEVMLSSSRYDKDQYIEIKMNIKNSANSIFTNIAVFLKNRYKYERSYEDAVNNISEDMNTIWNGLIEKEEELHRS